MFFCATNYSVYASCRILGDWLLIHINHESPLKQINDGQYSEDCGHTAQEAQLFLSLLFCVFVCKSFRILGDCLSITVISTNQKYRFKQVDQSAHHKNCGH